MHDYGLVHPRMLLELAPNFYASLCSLFVQEVVINRFGEETVNLIAIGALTNLPCRIAPKVSHERRDPQQTFVEGVMDVTIADYYPQIVHELAPVIDGLLYAMEGEPEFDGNNKTTRFEVRVVQGGER